MSKIKYVLRWLAAQFSLARLFFFIIFVGLTAAVVMSVASQQISDDYRLKPPPESSFKPVVPKGFGDKGA